MEDRSTTAKKIEGLPPPKSLDAIFEEMKSRRVSEPEMTMGWKQYNPWQREKPRRRRFLNTASIWVFAKKMIAREMRRAKGVKPKRDPRLMAMERYAQEYDRRKEEEKIRAQRVEEERQRRLSKQEMLEAMLGESVEAFAEMNLALKEEREEQKALTRLFRQALDSVGEVLELHRSNGGWTVRMEPWEEKRARRMRLEMDSPPAIYEVKLDKDFYITSASSGGDPFAAKRILARLNTELDRKIRKPLELQMEEARMLAKPSSISDVERRMEQERQEEDRVIAKLCEQALEDFGRVMKIGRSEDGEGWKVRVELFEEMGMRRRKPGKEPLLFDLAVDNDLKVTSYQGV